MGSGAGVNSISERREVFGYRKLRMVYVLTSYLDSIMSVYHTPQHDIQWSLCSSPWQVFSRGQDQDHRGLTPGFLEGPTHQRLVRGRAPRHRGVLLGSVADVRAAAAGRVGLTLRAPVKRGDGVVFDAGRPEEDECGEGP